MVAQNFASGSIYDMCRRVVAHHGIAAIPVNNATHIPFLQFFINVMQNGFSCFFNFYNSRFNPILDEIASIIFFSSSFWVKERLI